MNTVLLAKPWDGQTPSVRCPGVSRSGPPEGGTANRRRLRLVLALAAVLAGASLSAGQESSSVRIDPGHNLLQEAEAESAVPIGATVDFVTLLDREGVSRPVSVAKAPVQVIIFLSTQCPVAKKYTARLRRLHEELAPHEVTLWGVFPNAEETEEQIEKFVAAAALPFPILRDRLGRLTRAFGAAMTPQVFVLDRDQRLRYRGAIDDNRYTTRVKERFLHDAVAALLAGRTVPTAETRSLGCTIHLSAAAQPPQVTYAKHVAPILQKHCQSCHRPGQVGPFSLMSYAQAKAYATEIQAYTGRRLMPPWKAAPGFGTFQNDRSLAQEEIDLIARWVEEGTALGMEGDLPPPRQFRSEWTLGEPDLIVEMPEEYVIGPEGEDDYRHFIIPSNLGGDRYVSAIDVRPGNLQTVHHVIVYTDTSGEARRLDADDDGPGYTRFGGPGFEPKSMLGGWAPGTFPNVTPNGTGTFLPQGADIVLQVHYYRTGFEERDRTRVGFYFSDHPRPCRIQTRAVLNREFIIPPGAARHRVVARWSVERDLYAFSVYPHMHLLGEEIEVTVRKPDGTLLPLIWIPNWDFNWQGDYAFQEPLFLPQGSEVEVTAYYNNSEENPDNPHDPPRPVGWGEKTTDEMCLAFLSVVHASRFDSLTRPTRDGGTAPADPSVEVPR